MKRQSVLSKILISILLFLIFISGYAIVYTYCLSDEFLFTTARLEKSYNITAIASEDTIKSRILVAVKKHRRAFHPRAKQFYGDDKLTEMFVAQYDTSEVYIEFEGYNGEKLNYSTTVIGAEFFIGNIEVSIYKSSGRSYHRGDYLIKCNYRGTKVGMDGNIYLAIVEPAKTIEFKNLFFPEQGLKNNLLSRMFYFSSVTATTLGYGEIVPLSNSARYWVASESILGLIVMGLLVYWITRNKKVT